VVDDRPKQRDHELTDPVARSRDRVSTAPAEPVGPDDSLSGRLREAIRADGRSTHAIATAAGISANVVRLFDSDKVGLSLAVAGKLAVELGLQVGTAGDEDVVDRSLAGRLRAAIRDDGRTINAIARAAGIASLGVYEFASGAVPQMRLANVDKLAAVLGLGLGPGEKPAPPDEDDSLAEQLRAAIRDDPRAAYAIALAAGIGPPKIGVTPRNGQNRTPRAEEGEWPSTPCREAFKSRRSRAILPPFRAWPRS
jgi:hypothetical protein